MLARWRCWLALAGTLAATAALAEPPLPLLRVRPHEICQPAPGCETIGRVRLLGALTLASDKFSGQRLGGLSGLAWDADEGLLHAVSDQGALFGLKPEFRDGRLAGAQLVHAAPLLDPKTGKPVRWLRSDAEGLELFNSRNGHVGDSELVVSFEGEPRIARYHPNGTVITDVELPPALRDQNVYRSNRMLEAVCAHEREGLLTVPEKPLIPDAGALYFYRVRDGARWRLPKTLSGASAIECLPDGSVLLLEREFRLPLLHWRVALWRIALPAGTAADTTLDGQVLAVLDAGHGLHLDNFEGLTRHQGRRYFMVSDNNDNLLQQTLLVYLEILDN